MCQTIIKNPVIHIDDKQYGEALDEAIDIIQDISSSSTYYHAVWCLDRNNPYKHFDYRVTGHTIDVWQRTSQTIENNIFITSTFSKL